MPPADATAFGYEVDHRPLVVTRPDGGRIEYGYDPGEIGGRLRTLTTPSGTVSFDYDSAGRVSLASSPLGGGSVAYSYSFGLLTGLTITGPAPAEVELEYQRTASNQTDGWLAAVTLNGDVANRIQYTYDADGLVMAVGTGETSDDHQLSRDMASGVLLGSVLSKVGERLTVSPFGELSRQEVGLLDGSCSPGPPEPLPGCRLYLDQQFTRDMLGRVIQLVETVAEPPTWAAQTHTLVYAYEPSGRLGSVTRDGSPWITYGYDGNGNRTSWTDGWGSGDADYDVQDRLRRYGTATYRYTANGELLSKTSGSATVGYSYDARGGLRGVTLPDGVAIEYLLDHQDRRVGKKVDGTLVKGWIYAAGLQPIAEVDAQGQITILVYATGRGAPDSMVRAGVVYRLIADQLGSIRFVVDADTGDVVQRIDYDPFGRVTFDSSPGFQPFGFAGGLYDPQTRLVRFGARDFDAETGRWTAKDPIGFASAETSLYVYSSNDPVNAVDRTGLAGEAVVPDLGHLGVKNRVKTTVVEPYLFRKKHPESGGAATIDAQVFLTFECPEPEDEEPAYYFPRFGDLILSGRLEHVAPGAFNYFRSTLRISAAVDRTVVDAQSAVDHEFNAHLIPAIHAAKAELARNQPVDLLSPGACMAVGSAIIGEVRREFQRVKDLSQAVETGYGRLYEWPIWP